MKKIEKTRMQKQNKIHLLTDAVANQIAAGEVVQDMASIVKELLENALDAGSTDVQLIIENAGKTKIQVIDNGCGMNEIDARMAFERHATSKIQDAMDLFNIQSYGFRGEAMAAISSVASVEMITRTPEEELGTRIFVQASKVKKQSPVVASIGTNIMVHHCFSNIPVRRNFLKPNHIEIRRIIDEFQRIALARPDVTFGFLQDNKTIWQLPATKLRQRILHLFGKNRIEQLIPCEEVTDQLTLSGYIGAPNKATKKKSGHFFFVNNRYIQSNLLNHAVKQGFEPLLPVGVFPFYVLFITVPPNQVDVNVHPKKIEVKFQEEKLLYALLESSVKKALATNQYMHTIDFEQPSSHAIFAPNQTPSSTPPVKVYSIPPHPFSLNGTKKPLSYETAITTIHNREETQIGQSDSSLGYIFPNKLQLQNEYILAEVKSGLLLINQKRALERILYEKNLSSFKGKKSGHTQKLLFPYTLTLQPADANLVQACQEDLSVLGFRFEQNATTLIITGQPAHLQGYNLSMPDFFIDLLEQYRTDRQTELLSEQENWARALAKRANFKKRQNLTSEEMNGLIDQLFLCSNSKYTLDGLATWRIIPLEKIKTLLETPLAT